MSNQSEIMKELRAGHADMMEKAERWGTPEGNAAIQEAIARQQKLCDDLQVAPPSENIPKGELPAGPLTVLAIEVHQIAIDHGFWDGGTRNKGELIALMHSELSELLECERKGTADDLCDKYADTEDSAGTGVKHNVSIGLTNREEEVADILIRVLDYAASYGMDVDKAVRIKAKYNDSRPYKHGKKF